MKDFVTYELAVKLKEKGFREKCVWHYYDDTKDKYQSSSPQCYNYGGNTSDAPTISQVLKWLRDEKKLYIMILNWDFIIVDLNTVDIIFESRAKYSSYEESAIFGIEYVLDKELSNYNIK